MNVPSEIVPTEEAQEKGCGDAQFCIEIKPTATVAFAYKNFTKQEPKAGEPIVLTSLDEAYFVAEVMGNPFAGFDLTVTRVVYQRGKPGETPDAFDLPNPDTKFEV